MDSNLPLSPSNNLTLHPSALRLIPINGLSVATGGGPDIGLRCWDGVRDSEFIH